MKRVTRMSLGSSHLRPLSLRAVADTLAKQPAPVVMGPAFAGTTQMCCADAAPREAVIPRAGIQYAAAFRFDCKCLGVLDHPLARVMTPVLWVLRL
jgi:hypothetical protein